MIHFSIGDTLGQFQCIKLLILLTNGFQVRKDTIQMGGLYDWCADVPCRPSMCAVPGADSELQLCVHHRASHQDLTTQLYPT